MALELRTPSSADLIATAENLAVERFMSRAGRYEDEVSFPWDDYADLKEAGLIGLKVPREYGGRGADSGTYVSVLKALAIGNPSTALTFNMHSTVVGILAELATHEQKQRYFRDVVENGALMASITSEPSSSLRGTFALSTVARRVPGGFLVSGSKHFCSLSDAATYYFTWARLEGEELPEGLINLMIRSDSPGVRLERTWNSVAMRSTSSHSLHFEDVFVPEEDQVGEAGAVIERGLSDAYMLGYCAVYFGIAEGALRYTVDYARRTTFKPDNIPIAEFPSTQHHVAEMGMKVDAARLLLERAAAATEEDPRERARWLNLSKAASAEAAIAVTDLAIRTCGGRSLLKHHPLERYLRDARAGVIMPPHVDQCMEVVARYHLGLPLNHGFIKK